MVHGPLPSQSLHIPFPFPSVSLSVCYFPFPSVSLLFQHASFPFPSISLSVCHFITPLSFPARQSVIPTCPFPLQPISRPVCPSAIQSRPFSFPPIPSRLFSCLVCQPVCLPFHRVPLSFPFFNLSVYSITPLFLSRPSVCLPFHHTHFPFLSVSISICHSITPIFHFPSVSLSVCLSMTPLFLSNQCVCPSAIPWAPFHFTSVVCPSAIPPLPSSFPVCHLSVWQIYRARFLPCPSVCQAVILSRPIPFPTCLSVHLIFYYAFPFPAGQSVCLLFHHTLSISTSDPSVCQSFISSHPITFPLVSPYFIYSLTPLSISHPLVCPSAILSRQNVFFF